MSDVPFAGSAYSASPWTPLHQVSPHLRNAVVNSEDDALAAAEPAQAEPEDLQAQNS